MELADRLALDAETAADLMTPNPISIPEDMPIRKAAAVLATQEISAVLVVNAAGRPAGVLSRTDIVRCLREPAPSVCEAPGRQPQQPAAVPLEAIDTTPVKAVMTPAILSVTPETPVLEVVAQMLALGRVHRLFVMDDSGVVVGVISATDVLRKLRRLETL
jgi:CBS domain-containing protein